VIEVVIDQLVVHGLSPSEAQTVAVALEARLAAVARDGEVASRSDQFRRAGAVTAPAGNPAALGEAVAGAVWGAVRGSGGR
jgi:hypothetical protein